MKDIMKNLIISNIAILLFIYITTAFVKSELNVFILSEAIRGTMVFVWVLLTVASIAITLENYEKN